VKASELTTTLTLNHESLCDVLEQLRRTPAGLDALLSKMIPCGVAFHHAGMSSAMTLSQVPENSECSALFVEIYQKINTMSC